MVEKEIKYMGQKYKYKSFFVPGEKDIFGRDKTINIGKQSEAEQMTNESTGVMYWSAGVFVDMQINTYISDEEYDNLTTDGALLIAKKVFSK